MEIKQVYDIFNDFFGEERVDLQDTDIIVHFPKVTVTNEYNKSVDITHLWVKVPLNSNGTIANIFCMVRSEYTYQQFVSGYSHSHLPRLNGEISWKQPCLGNGPLRNTVMTLMLHESEELWGLFCLELSKYVEVESISGVPYIRLESIGSGGGRYQAPIDIYRICSLNVSPAIVDPFIKYVISKHPFVFNYNNESYGIGASTLNIVLTLSKLFIEYYNSLENKPCSINELIMNNVIKKSIISDGSLEYIKDTPSNIQQGDKVLTFKGKDITLKITNGESIDNYFYTLGRDYVIYIVDTLLKIANSYNGEINTIKKVYL